jgi:hypothetical protein
MVMIEHAVTGHRPRSWLVIQRRCRLKRLKIRPLTQVQAAVEGGSVHDAFRFLAEVLIG